MSILLERHNPANMMVGEIMISQQWVTPSQLEEAVREQARTNEKLGGILVRLGHLSQMELDFILAQQKGNTITGEAENVQLRVGDILRKSSRLKQRDLAVAVDEQKKTNEKLGTVLTRLGLIDETELSAVLSYQSEFNQGDPMAVRLLLGEILISSKRISRKQLSEALAQQKLTKKQIGQILMESGHVSKLDLRNALKIQSKMVAAMLVAMVGASMATGCAAPTVPTTSKAMQSISYGQQQMKQQRNRKLAQFDNIATPYKVANLPGGKQLQVFSDGSRVIGGVPFFQQGSDNTCAQASTSVVLNYHGNKQSYQSLVSEQNRFNLPTHYSNIVKYIQSKGVDAKAYRGGNLSFLKSLIDAGKPPIVLLEFNNDMFQQHYITVVGYNELSGKIIFHDSIDGPYSQLDEDEFFAMWQSPHLANLPLFGGANYQGLIIEAGN